MVACVVLAIVAGAVDDAPYLPALPQALQGDWIDARDHGSAGTYADATRSSSCSTATLTRIQHAADGTVQFDVTPGGTSYRIVTRPGGYTAIILAHKAAGGPLVEVDRFDFTVRLASAASRSP